jgi:transcriptional regulator with XRE-family HTH domain
MASYLWQTNLMTGIQSNGAAGHFGRQMKKERLARGWSLMELAQRMEVDPAHLGRVEGGKRPPTENLATRCDRVFPERKEWFSEFYEESRHWPEVPATFKSWPEYEDRATTLRVWSPSIIHGLLQTEAYARALITVQPAISQETVGARLASRMERQKRVLGRDNPPSARFVVDELSLYREVAGAQAMAAQLRHLLEVAAMPTVTIQVMPAVAHPVNASGFLMADDAVWIEHTAGGFVYTEQEVIAGTALRFDILRGECYRVSESLALIERLEGIWKSGVSPLTRTATAETA